MATNCYEVVGIAKTGGRQPLVLRRFADESAAISHALAADMSAWDDVWVRPGTKIVELEPTEPPPFPWSVLWVGGYAYVTDANGKKIASLLGSQKQRELVAGVLCDLTPATLSLNTSGDHQNTKAELVHKL